MLENIKVYVDEKEDITKILDLTSLLPEVATKIDGIIGGPPCQGCQSIFY